LCTIESGIQWDADAATKTTPGTTPKTNPMMAPGTTEINVR
jgi:hypothetical protein